MLRGAGPLVLKDGRPASATIEIESRGGQQWKGNAIIHRISIEHRAVKLWDQGEKSPETRS